MHLDQNSNYEWIGTFWFPDKENNKYSGKITYSPEHGIKLIMSLSREPDILEIKNDIDTHFLSKKLIHAIISGERPAYLSLVNVRLYRSLTIGSPTVLTWNGNAELLIFGYWFEENDQFNKIEFAYDDQFNNIFSWPHRRVNDTLKLADGNPITLSSDCSLEVDLFSLGEFIVSVEDLDSVISAREKTKLEELKEAAKPIIEDEIFSFYKRHENHPSVSFTMKNRGFDSYREVEFKWRKFWQFITDQRISIKRVWVYTNVQFEENKIENRRFTALLSYYGRQEKGHRVPSRHELPITINSFGQDETNLNLTVIENTIQEWFRISNDDRFKPVLNGVLRAMQGKNKIVDTTHYVSLISEIETLLDIQGEKNANVDKLVELHADQDWIDGFMNFATCTIETESIGQWYQEIRNAIVHPRSAKKKSGGKYLKVASDPFQLQKAYAHLSGLYLKAILLYLGNINKDHIEEYIKLYIKRRSSFIPIEYI